MDYEKPTVQVSDDSGEMVYATGSGEGHKLPSDLTPGIHQTVGENDCWSIEVTKDQTIAHEKICKFRVVAVHSNSMQHISTATTITVTFNQTITDANFEGFVTSVNGSVVTATRDQLGDSYMSGDNYNTLLEVKCLTEDAASACQAIDYQIKCTKSVNVQGNGGNE